MSKSFNGFGILCVLFLLITAFFQDKHDHKSDDRLKAIGEVLVNSYPQFISHAGINTLYFCDGDSLLLSDGIGNKSYDSLLNYPDIEDQFKYHYIQKESIIPGFQVDPGRIRFDPLFKKMYGSNKQEVRKNLVTIVWLPNTIGKEIQITSINDVDQHLQLVSEELDTRPDLAKYLKNIGGTFNWREIAGTSRLSPHSYGIAIDINTEIADYWRWNGEIGSDSIKYVNRIPYDLVEIFEKNGFIWGGRWYHYDTMHFEFRPEILASKNLP